MLKQSASRNVRGKSLKVKHALQIFVVVAICVWFLYNLKHPHHINSEMEALDIGRKQLKPRVDELMMEREGGEEVEVEVEVEVEHDQMQDFIDEDDKDQLLVVEA